MYKSFFDPCLFNTSDVDAMQAYWDKQQICRFATQAYVDWFGRSPQEMIGKITLQELLGCLYETNLPYIQGALKGEHQMFEKEIHTSTGEKRHSLINYFPDIVNGVVEGFFVQIAEITMQMRQKQIQENAKRHQKILDSIPHMIWTTDANGKCTFINKQWYSYTRLDEAELQHFNFISFIHEEDRKHVFKQRDLSLKTGRPFQATFRFKNHLGEYRWMLGQTLHIYDDQGKLTERIGTATDVHEQLTALEAAEASERQFRFMTNTITQIIWTTLPNGEVDYVNDRWVEYTGKSLEETNGLQWSDLLHPEDIESTFVAWKKALETGSEFKIEQRIRNRQGEYRWFLSQAFPLKEATGNISKWFGNSTNIHDDKIYVQQIKESYQQINKKNQQLSRLNVDLDNFVYTASHDLRAPVASIKGLHQLLTKKLQDRLSTDELALIELTSSSIARLDQMIEALGKIARSQQEEEQMSVNVDFSEVMEDVKASILTLMKEKEVEIQINFEVASVIFFRKFVHSILYNLISNAIKYRSPNRSPIVQIQTRQLSEYVCLSVLDNGLGIESQQISKLFLPFKRLHTHIEGTGIGLYMIKRIIENYGGYIRVESQLGIGTAFHVFFKS